MFSHSIRSSALLALFAGLAALPSSASAQQLSDTPAVQALIVAPAAASTTTVVSDMGPRFAPAGVTSKLQMAPVDVTQSMYSAGESVGRNRAMMGVGLAAVIVGLVLSGDVGTLFVVGGALVGLVGLYHYMK
jgi:hypothetical protein